MTKSHHIGAIAVAFFALLGMSQTISAASHSSAAPESWAEEHPRREEVDVRVENQEKHIDNLEEKGKLTTGEANKMIAADQKILAEEKSDASGTGHITAEEQNGFNKSIDSIGKWISHDVLKNAE